MTPCYCTRTQPDAELQRLLAERDRLCAAIRETKWRSPERDQAIRRYEAAVTAVQEHEREREAERGRRG